MTWTLWSANISGSSLQSMMRPVVFLAGLRVAGDLCHTSRDQVRWWCLRPGPDTAVTWRPSPPRPRHPASLYFNLGSLCGQAETGMATHHHSHHTLSADPEHNKCELNVENDGLFTWLSLTALPSSRPQPTTADQKLDTSTDNGLDCMNTFVKREDKNFSNIDIARIRSIIQ